MNRLHQNVQQLMMSFLNLQARTCSHGVIKSGITIDNDLSDIDMETETEGESMMFF